MKRLVYLISPKRIYKNFYDDLSKVLISKKVGYFQLRLKNTSKKKVVKIGKKIRPMLVKHKVKFIINDNAVIAKNVKADGCHIGQMDEKVSKVKKILKNKIIGVTCHNSKILALEAVNNKANYVAFGSFYISRLKPKAKKANLNVLKWAKKNIKKPIVVIGGINNKNYKKLINLGANYIAISSFIWDNPVLKPEEAIKKFK